MRRAARAGAEDRCEADLDRMAATEHIKAPLYTPAYFVYDIHNLMRRCFL